MVPPFAPWTDSLGLHRSDRTGIRPDHLPHDTGQPRRFFPLRPSTTGYIAHNLLNPNTQVSIGNLPSDVPWPGDLNGSLWTLFYESACYLMVAALGASGLLGPKDSIGAALLLCILGLYSVRCIVSPATWVPPMVGRLFDTPGKVLTMYFFAGTLWALIPGAARVWMRAFWPGLVACALLIVSWHWGIHRWLRPWGMPPALFWLAGRLPFTSFANKVGGDYSYGMYIYGYPVEQMLAHFGVAALGYPAFLLASILGSGLLAAASWHWIEWPALSLKNLAIRGALTNRIRIP